MTKRPIFFLKIAAALAGLAALLLVAGGLVLKRYLPPEKIRSLILENAQKALKREVKLQSVELGVLKGLTVQGLELSETPDFKAGKFAEARSISVRVQLLPLLHRKIIVDKISVDGLRLSVSKGADGRFNFSDLSDSKAAAPAVGAAAVPAAAGSAGFDLDVRRLSLTDAGIAYRDIKAGDQVSISKMEMSLKDFNVKDEFAADLSFEADGRAAKRAIRASVVFSGAIDPAGLDMEKIGISMKKFTLDVPEGRLKATGKIKGTKLSSVDLIAEVALKDVSPIEIQASGVLAEGSEVSARVKIPALKSDELRKFSAAIPAGVPIPAAELAALFSLKRDDLTLKSASLKAKGADIQASGTVHAVRSGSPTPELSVTAKLDVSALKAADLSFLRSFGINVPENLNFPPSALETNASFGGNTLGIKALRFKTQGAEVAVSGTISQLRSKRPIPALSVSAKLDLPAMNSHDLAVLKLAKVEIPEKLTLPSSKLDAQVSIDGEDVGIKSLHLRAQGVSLDVSGAIRKARTAPEPNVAVVANLDLPALASADFAFIPGVPKGLNIPASKLEAEFSVAPEEVNFKFFRFFSGGNSASAKARIAHWKTKAPYYDVTLHVPTFALDQVTQLSPETRDMKLAGTGSVKLNVKGTWASPEEFYLIADFKGVGATVSGLELSDFNGTIKGDKVRIDVANLKGKVNDGALSLNLSLKNYAKTPAVELDGSLTKFDVGRFMAAQAARAKPATGPAEKAPPAAAQPSGKFINAKGWFNIGELIHPKISAEDVKLSWDLMRITPDLRGLHGQAGLSVGKGQFHNIADIGLVKLLSGLAILPNISNTVFSAISGASNINEGLMTVSKFEIDSDAFRVYDTEGTIDIPTQKLKLLTTVQAGRIAAVYVNVGGTISNPTGGLGVGKSLEKTVEKAITDPASVQQIIKDPSKLLKGLFGPR